MAKITATEPSAPVHVDQKPKFTSFQDSLGRTIQLRTLDPLQKSRIIMAVGAEASANTMYVNAFALPAAAVVYIDDMGYGLPQTLKQIETVLSDLGGEGYAAIEAHLMAEYEAAKAAADAKITELSSEQAAAKN